MKRFSLTSFLVGASLFTSCEKKETTYEAAPTTPQVVIVPVAVPTNADPVENTSPPLAIPVEDQSPDEEEPSAPDTDPELVRPTAGERLDHAINKTEQGVRTAAEKTEQGLRKAAEKTGGALQRVGEAIQKKANEP